MRLNLYRTTREDEGSEAMSGVGTMIRQLKIISVLLGIGLALMLPPNTYAGLFLNVPDVTINGIEVKTRIFGPGVSQLSEDSRFAYVTPLANEFTFFYQITNLDFATFAFLNNLTMFIPPASPLSDQRAGTIFADQSVTPASIFPGFTFGGFEVPTQISFDLGGIGLFESVDVFFSTTYLPNINIPNGVLFDTSGGLVSASLVGPDDPPGAAAPMPEPGTLLLLGSGLLGLAGLRRKNSKRHKKR